MTRIHCLVLLLIVSIFAFGQDKSCLKDKPGRMVYRQLQSELSELSKEELVAPAYFGHETHCVLIVNDRANGVQIMRFNPAYWERTLPHTAVQFITFMKIGQAVGGNGRDCPDYRGLFENQIRYCEMATLV
jgi:hypothetical protein